jgi:hypothetical protein
MGAGVTASAQIDPFSVAAQTGYFGASSTTEAPPGIARSTGPGSVNAGSTSLTSFRNPLTWFAIFAAATFGLIGFSSSARVGKARVKANIGKE